MFSQAPIVAAARGTGLLNMVSSFNASVLISVMLFCIAWNLITPKQLKKGKNGGSTTKSILYTKAAKANVRGNAQANIMIIPNCNANSKKSAGES